MVTSALEVGCTPRVKGRCATDAAAGRCALLLLYVSVAAGQLTI